MKKTKKLWGDGFKKKPKQEVISFTAGRDIRCIKAADYTLLPYDIWVNKAHTVMLCKQKLITKKDAQIILRGLIVIDQLSKKGEFKLNPEQEDVHTNIESWLIEQYGIESAGKIHTARSRNDQTNVDTRLYLRDQVLSFSQNITLLIEALTYQAEKYKTYIMPGFTHHQPAMITTFGHTLLGFASMLLRDVKRFNGWYELHNYNSLGNIVSYGTSLPIDQYFSSQLLGFKRPEINSLDSITNRWEAEADLAFDISVFMNHLSLIAQTFIIFSTAQFNLITLSDEYSTGSSIMPQKKNPDPLEVIKGKTSYIEGLLQSLLGIGKASFIGYNRDTQWTKYAIMDIVDESFSCPLIMKDIILTIKVNKNEMSYWCHKDFIGATHLLERLVSEYAIPFRKAKVIVEKAVAHSRGEDIVTYGSLMCVFKDEKIYIKVSKKQLKSWQNPHEILSSLQSFGSPGKEHFELSMKLLNKEIQLTKDNVDKKIEQRNNAKSLLDKEVGEII